MAATKDNAKPKTEIKGDPRILEETKKPTKTTRRSKTTNTPTCPQEPFVAFTEGAVFVQPGGFGWKVTLRAKPGETMEDFLDRIERMDSEMLVRGYSSRYIRPQPTTSEEDADKKLGDDASSKQNATEGNAPEIRTPIRFVQYHDDGDAEYLLLFEKEEQESPTWSIDFQGFTSWLRKSDPDKAAALVNALWSGRPVSVEWISISKPLATKPSRFEFPVFLKEEKDAVGD